METKKEELKEEEIQLLKTGMKDNVSLLNENDLSDIFGGYNCHNYITTHCPSNYYECD